MPSGLLLRPETLSLMQRPPLTPRPPPHLLPFHLPLLLPRHPPVGTLEVKVPHSSLGPAFYAHPYSDSAVLPWRCCGGGTYTPPLPHSPLGLQGSHKARGPGLPFSHLAPLWARDEPSRTHKCLGAEGTNVTVRGTQKRRQLPALQERMQSLAPRAQLCITNDSRNLGKIRSEWGKQSHY